ncbi:hypothetical protein PG994_001238 [Apiospora phragmitis]|uniref:Uncharacterized protein n=1 Tax=Apiospora phragmitis TaxID=2905665 RepID=A0ABR1WSZ7_9PEZI
MSPINWSASPVEMEAAYKAFAGRRAAEVELFKNQPKPTQADLERANLVISSADEECIFIIYHTAKDAQATEEKQEGRAISGLKALWRDFRLARAARREFKGREGADEPSNSRFITLKREEGSLARERLCHFVETSSYPSMRRMPLENGKVMLRSELPASTPAYKMLLVIMMCHPGPCRDAVVLDTGLQRWWRWEYSN